MDMTLFRRNLPNFTFGFDTLLDDIERFATYAAPSKFPPYNILQLDDENYHIEVAVAGYKRDDIQVIHDKEHRRLVIKGEIEKSEEDETRNYTYRGLSNRNFTLSFFIGDHFEVADASLVDGLLDIQVNKFMPEEMKPKQIEIQSKPLLESKTSKKKLKVA
jgi:molecular chaperone IbpA